MTLILAVAYCVGVQPQSFGGCFTTEGQYAVRGSANWVNLLHRRAGLQARVAQCEPLCRRAQCQRRLLHLSPYIALHQQLVWHLPHHRGELSHSQLSLLWPYAVYGCGQSGVVVSQQRVQWRGPQWLEPPRQPFPPQSCPRWRLQYFPTGVCLAWRPLLCGRCRPHPPLSRRRRGHYGRCRRFAQRG